MLRREHFVRNRLWTQVRDTKFLRQCSNEKKKTGKMLPRLIVMHTITNKNK